jgi:TonB family C-terminal domain
MHLDIRSILIVLLCIPICPAGLQAKKKEIAPERWVEIGGEKLPVYTTESLPPSHTSPPEYPDDEKRAGIQGEALILALIDVDGRPVELTLQESRPVPAFGQAAKEAVSRWRFQKVQQGGKPTRYIIYAPVFFRLSNR